MSTEQDSPSKPVNAPRPATPEKIFGSLKSLKDRGATREQLEAAISMLFGSSD